MSRRPFIRALSGREGFTLVELIIVISILSVMAMVVAPRIANFMNAERSGLIVVRALISKAFDDAFVKGRTNYVVFHLYERDMELSKFNEGVFERKNAISVLNLSPEGKFTDSPQRLLRFHEFSDAFRIEEVLFAGGQVVRRGNVLVPFHPAGYSDDVIVHVLVNGTDQRSVRISKFLKEPSIEQGYARYE
ncbi:MAG: type II secretion system protein [Spirochaetes bacterium]|nr:MAG: type II secretion system protein [Spirochaetota bacterium]